MGSRVTSLVGVRGKSPFKLEIVLSLRSVKKEKKIKKNLVHYAATDKQFTILYSRLLVSQNNTSGQDRDK